MDEKKMAEEFAKIWKAVGENSGAIIDTNRDLGKIATCLDKHRDTINEIIRVANNNIDNFNHNVRIGNADRRKFVRYCRKQNIAILAGIGGFLYLCKKIQKLEDATKKE